MAVSSAIIACGAFARADKDAAREAAIDWATDKRAEIFDLIMPLATRNEVRSPVCRVTTLRSPGSVDSFEFFIRIVERCDELPVTGEVHVPRDEPLTVQLAKLRIRHEAAATDAELINQMQVTRRELSTAEASKILKILRNISVSPVASDELLVDRRRFELSSASWTLAHLEFLDIEHRPGWKRLPEAVRSILSIVGIREGELHFDPRELEGRE